MVAINSAGSNLYKQLHFFILASAAYKQINFSSSNILKRCYKQYPNLTWFQPKVICKYRIVIGRKIELKQIYLSD